MSICMTSPKELGRGSGLVLRFVFGIVAVSPKSNFFSLSRVVNEKLDCAVSFI